MFSIYKKGQGKYVRLGTVIGVGILVLLGIQWIIDTFLPLQPAYVKASVALAAGLAGAWLCFWVVNRPRHADFMILAESEMKKVVWPTPPAVVRATRLVVFLTLGMALMLYLVDAGFVWFFKAIHVIR